MAKTPAKKKPVKVRQDFAQNAFRVVQEATGQARMPIRVVFYRDQDDKSIWIAHCLEFDLLGNGADWNEAMEMLTEAIGIQLKNTLRSKNIDNLFCSAPAEFHMMFAKGKGVEAQLHVELHVDHFEIDEVQFRQYEGSRADIRDLALV